VFVMGGVALFFRAPPRRYIGRVSLHIAPPPADLETAPSRDGQEPNEFIKALESLRLAQVPPSVTVEEVEAPRGVSQYSAAIDSRTLLMADGESVGTGSFVILYDQEQISLWGSPFRLVAGVRAQIDEEASTDPYLGQITWARLPEELDRAGAGYSNVSGTVTRTLSESFGGIELTRAKAHVELRCSWSPTSEDLAPHMVAWLHLVSQMAGIRPFKDVEVVV